MTQNKGKSTKRGAPKTGGGGRGLKVRVKTARGRPIGSQIWLQRQLNDPYVARARAEGYRSRAAFKLIELDDKFRILKPGARILDLGAAPGGWSQIAKERAGASSHIVGVDILDMDPLAGVILMKLDVQDKDAPAKIREALGGPADVVLSDMAAATTGHRATDHIRTVALVELALETALDVLKPGGVFVGKVFQGGATPELLAQLRAAFADVRHVKPPASRAASVELYFVATGFRGRSVSR